MICGGKMELKINLKMDKRWFGIIIIAVLFIIIVYFLNYGTTNVSLITVNNLQNCSVQQQSYPSYFSNYNSKIPDCCYPIECPQSKNNPVNCSCFYPVYCTNYSGQPSGLVAWFGDNR